MKINIAIVALVLVAVLCFIYFVIVRNNKDKVELEDELNEQKKEGEKHLGKRI